MGLGSFPPSGDRVPSVEGKNAETEWSPRHLTLALTALVHRGGTTVEPCGMQYHKSRQNRVRTARSVWSACSLLPLPTVVGSPSALWHSTVRQRSTAAASCTHSKR